MLAHARALIDLGAALRRAGNRAPAASTRSARGWISRTDVRPARSRFVHAKSSWQPVPGEVVTLCAVATR